MPLRRAQPEDVEEVVAVLRRARAGMTYLPDLHTAEERRAFVGGLIREHEVWVAEDDGRVVAFAALGDAMLDHLYVDPAAQGRGFGKALLDEAKLRRPHGFRLWVFQANTGAIRFYVREGCRIVKLTDGSDNEEREPDALCEWLPGPDA